jgi:hypothetical protein
MIFAVSDIKEGFYKEFYDTLNIHDFDIPLLMMFDNTKKASIFKKYLYPAKDHFTYE